MADEKKSKGQSFTKRFEEEFEIPEHLAASVRAMGASFAQGKFQKPSVPLSTKPKNSPEELAKLIDHLQETFGSKAAGNSATGATKKVRNSRNLDISMLEVLV